MHKKRMQFALFLVLVLVLTGCGKTIEGGDDKKEVEKMVEMQRNLMKASDTAEKDVQKVILAFDGDELSYETLKNIIKGHLQVQITLKEQIVEQNHTEYRTKINETFAAVIEGRISNYEHLLEMVRMKDEKALKERVETMKKVEEEAKASRLIELNELLAIEGIKELDALEK